MSETFIIFLIGSVSALAGAYVGNLIARLRATTEKSKLEERIERMNEHEDRLEQQFRTALNEKEEVRKEKDFLKDS